MQSIWRGYAARLKVGNILVTKRADSRYFTYEERQETLSKNSKHNPKSKREIRGFTYKSGAIYQGEWRGGFRDGQGK